MRAAHPYPIFLGVPPGDFTSNWAHTGWPDIKKSITMASMQFSILHTNTATWCTLKKKKFPTLEKVSWKKKPNQSLEQTASLPGKQATIQSTQAGFQIVFKPCREILINIHEDRAYKFKVTTRRMWQFQTNKNVNLMSVAWLVIYRNCIN